MATSAPSSVGMTGNKTPEEIIRIKHDFNVWFIWGVLAPISVPILIWIFSLLENIENPFAVNFSGADMLVVAVMLLVTVGQDIEKLPQGSILSGFSFQSESFKWLSIIVWILYGYMKLSCLRISEDLGRTAGAAQIAEKVERLSYYGVASFLLLAIVLLVSIRVRIAVKNFQLRH